MKADNAPGGRGATVLAVIFWLAFALLVAAVAGIRFEVLSTGQGFLLMGVGALVVTLFAVISLLGTLAGLARGRGIVGRRLGYVVVGALPAALVLATVGVAGFQAPPIHDITTDFADPPAFVFAAADRGPGDNPVAYDPAENIDHQRRHFPGIEPLLLPVAPDRALALARSVMEESGWRVLGSDAAAGTLEGVYRSAIFGFEDDVVVRVRAEGQGSRIDVRSASRVGRGDLGANAARVRAFVAALEEKAGK